MSQYRSVLDNGESQKRPRRKYIVGILLANDSESESGNELLGSDDSFMFSDCESEPDIDTAHVLSESSSSENESDLEDEPIRESNTASSDGGWENVTGTDYTAKIYPFPFPTLVPKQPLQLNQHLSNFFNCFIQMIYLPPW